VNDMMYVSYMFECVGVYVFVCVSVHVCVLVCECI